MCQFCVIVSLVEVLSVLVYQCDDIISRVDVRVLVRQSGAIVYLVEVKLLIFLLDVVVKVRILW